MFENWQVSVLAYYPETICGYMYFIPKIHVYNSNGFSASSDDVFDKKYSDIIIRRVERERIKKLKLN